MIENQNEAVQLNFELVQRIYDNQVGKSLTITGELDINPFNRAEFFSANIKIAFEKNQTIKRINLSSSSPEAITVLLPVLQNPQNKINWLRLENLSPEAMSALLPAVQNPQSNVFGLILSNLSPEAITTLLPALQNPQSRVTVLQLSNLSPEAITALLPALQNLQSTVNVLILGNLSLEAITELLPALQHPQSKVTMLRLYDLSSEEITALLPALQHPQSKVNMLKLYDLSSEEITALLPALQHPQSKVTLLLLDRLSLDAITALLPALQHPQSKIKEIYVDNLSEDLVTFICLNLQNNQHRPEIKFISSNNISPLCKDKVDQLNKKSRDYMESQNINGHQNSENLSNKRTFELDLQAQGPVTKKICLVQNNNMEKAMNVQSMSSVQENQIMNNANNFQQDSHQHSNNSNINNLQSIHDDGNAAYPVCMENLLTYQQLSNNNQLYGNYYSNSNCPQSQGYSQNMQQLNPSLFVQHLNNSPGYNPTIFRNPQSVSPSVEPQQRPKVVKAKSRGKNSV